MRSVPATCAIVTGVALAAVAALAGQRGWAVERELWLVRGTGWVALAALALALCATPVARLSSWLGRAPRAADVTRWRRALGVTSAAVAALHATITLGTYLDGSWEIVPDWPYLRAGLAALLILLSLWITSYPRVVRALGLKLWKELHRLAYVAGLLVLQHVWLGPFGDRALALAVAAVVVGVGLLRLLPTRARSTRAAPTSRSRRRSPRPSS